MKIHDLIQGSPEWLAYRAQHFNASDAPAMMGCSPYMTRTELLQQYSTGIAKEVDAGTQRRFDDGHRFEALARPLAEAILEEDLYPVTGSEGKLSASFDGMTMGGETLFEHKSLNDALRACLPVTGSGFDCDVRLPDVYRVQMEQQLMIAGAEQVLFMASKWNGNNDQLVEERHCWYASDPALRAQIIAGWAQFEADLQGFVASTPAAVVVAAVVTALPSVSVQVTGEIAIKDNFKSFEVALRDFIDHKLIREPSTDQHFADLKLQIEALERAEAALNAAETQMLAQVSSVDAAKRTKDMLLKLARDNRLMAEKLLEARKLQIKTEIVAGGNKAFEKHVRELNASLGRVQLPQIHADFAGVVKNKRTVASLQDAVDTELARVKIEASSAHLRLDKNLRTIDAQEAYAFLFADVAVLVAKAPDDLALLIKSRIADREAKELQRQEAERLRIRIEEQAKAQREADARAAETLRQEREAQAERDRAAEIERKRAQDEQNRIDRETKAEADRLAESERLSKWVDNGKAVSVIHAAPAPAPAALAVVPFQRAAAQAPVANEPATLNLGAICARLGFTVTAAFMSEQLHIQPAAVDKTARLYRESQWPLICAALARHIAHVCELQAA